MDCFSMGVEVKLFWKKKKEEKKKSLMFEGKPIIEDYRVDKHWYSKKLFIENFVQEGNWGVIYEQGSWDGFANRVDLLNFMESQGWLFVFADTSLQSEGVVELVFRKIVR